MISSFYVNSQNNFNYKICETEVDNRDIKKTLFLIGEYHWQKGNFQVGLSYDSYLKENDLFPKYFVDESSPSYGYLFNRYISTGNELILKILDPTKQYWDVFREQRLYQQSSSVKIKYVGVDIEQFNYIAHYALREIFSEVQMPCNYSETWNTDSNNDTLNYAQIELCEIINSIKSIQNPLASSNKGLKKDLDEILLFSKSSDSVLIKKNLGDNLFFEFTQIMTSYEISKKRKRLFVVFESDKFQIEREKFMTNQIYQLFAKDSTAIVYGQFGIDHVLLSTYKKHPKPYEKIRLGIALNNDKAYPLTNNKVCSNVIYYDYFKPSMYKFLQSDLKKIPNEFSKMKDCQLKILDFENKSKANNLILFKTK